MQKDKPASSDILPLICAPGFIQSLNRNGVSAPCVAVTMMSALQTASLTVWQVKTCEPSLEQSFTNFSAFENVRLQIRICSFKKIIYDDSFI